MKKMNAWRGIAAVLLGSVFPVAGASHWDPRQEARPARIHIRLVDMVGLPEKLRSDAEEMVRELFRQARIDLDFAGDPAGGAEFWLQILKRPPNHLQRDATGFAVLVASKDPGDSYAAVSLPMVEAAARHLEAPLAEVLAASMAHEIGHLLLHSSYHSRSGIMSPRLDRRQIQLLERGELLFQGNEAARMAEGARRIAP